MRIAVIGAGVAGLACAGELAAAGHEVTVFEKARGPAGARPAAGPTTARSTTAARCSPAGLAARVRAARARFADFAHGEVPVPRMSALPRALAHGLDVRAGVRCRRSRVTARGATATADDGKRPRHRRPGRGEAPAPQAADLLRSSRPTSPSAPRRSRTTRAGRRSPRGTRRCPSRRRGSTPATGTPGSPARRGRARNPAATPGSAGPSRPERTGVGIGSRTIPASSRRRSWRRSARPAAPDRSQRRRLTAHRWRYARVTTPLAVACLVDADGRSAPRATGASRPSRRSTPARCSREPAFRRLCTAGAPSPARSWTDRRMRPERAIRSGHAPAHRALALVLALGGGPPRGRERRHERRAGHDRGALLRRVHGHLRQPRAQQHHGEPARPGARHALRNRRADPVRPEKEDLSPQPRCKPLPNWTFTLGTGYKTRAVSGPWGSLSIVTEPVRDRRHDEGVDPAAEHRRPEHRRHDRGRGDDHAHPGAGEHRRPAQQPLDPGRHDRPIPSSTSPYPGEYGFGALRCAIDNLNGDNVEWIGFPQGSKHVFCYAYYVKPPPTSGTIIVRKE